MMAAKRILIVENVEAEFDSIKTALNRVFSDQIEILPTGTSGNDYNNYNYLIEAFKTGDEKFQEIYSFFGQIDLYVLDVSLEGEKDNRGIEFFIFLKDRLKLDFKAIFISLSPKGSLPLPRTGSFDFISKQDYGGRYPAQLASKVGDIFNLDFLPKDQPGIAGSDPLAADQKDTKGWALRKYQKIKALKLPWLIDRTAEVVNHFLKIAVLDVVIRAAFYLLIIFTSLSALVNISKAILVSLPSSALKKIWSILEKILPLDPIQKEVPSAILPLLTAESIFLNMLPIFIVFGFYNYYETNVREYFLQGNLQKISEEISTKPMNVSKILFISSMISYLFIKIIELISELSVSHSSTGLAESSETVNRIAIPVDLISYGTVLLVLIGYFAYLNRKHE